MHVRFTAATPTHVEHSADAEASAQSGGVMARFRQQEAQWTQSKQPCSWQREIVLLAVSFEDVAGWGGWGGVDMDTGHSGGNIRAFRLTTGTVCVCTVG